MLRTRATTDVERGDRAVDRRHLLLPAEDARAEARHGKRRSGVDLAAGRDVVVADDIEEVVARDEQRAQLERRRDLDGRIDVPAGRRVLVLVRRLEDIVRIVDVTEPGAPACTVPKQLAGVVELDADRPRFSPVRPSQLLAPACQAMVSNETSCTSCGPVRSRRVPTHGSAGS